MTSVSSRFRLGHLFCEDDASEGPAVDASAPPSQFPAEDGREPAPGQKFAEKQAEYLGSLFKRDREAASVAIRELRNLADTPSRKRFVEDNSSVMSLFYENDVWEVAKSTKRALSKETTAASLWETASAEVESRPDLAQKMFKLGGMGGIRDDMAKKLCAALLGGVQLPTEAIGGADVIVPASANGKNGVWVSVKMVPMWGLIPLVSWHLSDDDAERFLDESGLGLMREGAPVERAAARKRAAVESIAASLGDHEYILLAVKDDGSWDEMVFAPGTLIREGFQDGSISLEETARGEVAYDASGGQAELLRYEAFLDVRDGSSKSAFLEERDGRLWLALDQDGVSLFSQETGAYLNRRAWKASAQELERATLCRATARDIIFKRCD